MRVFWYGAVLLVCAFALPAFASETEGTILPTNKDAWGDVIGWINAAPTDGTGYRGLHITDSAVTGYAWSREHGWINFGPLLSGQGVTNTPEGQLGGYAWVENLGWVSMSPVSINTQGYFVGIAGTSGADAGRISFDCARCSVRTDWRPESVRGGGTGVTTTPPGGGGGPTGTRIDPPVSPPPSVPVLPLPPTPLISIPQIIQAVIPAVVAAPVALPIIPNEQDTIPDYLLDISFRLEKSIVGVGEAVRMYGTFARFGLLNTPVGVVYTIYSDTGVEIDARTSSFMLESERVDTAVFEGLQLPPGRYRAEMVVSYGDGTREVFSQSFSVVMGNSCWIPEIIVWLLSLVPFLAWFIMLFGCWFLWLLILLIVVLLLWWYWSTRERKDSYELL